MPVISIDFNGSVAYISGHFTLLGGQARAGLGAVDINGNLTNWSPTVNGVVNGIAADTDYIYVGGNFTTANGLSQFFLAAFAKDGTLRPNWNVRPLNTVRNVFVDENYLYVLGGYNIRDNFGGGSSSGVVFRPGLEARF